MAIMASVAPVPTGAVITGFAPSPLFWNAIWLLSVCIKLKTLLSGVKRIWL
jgi:hypothetical protein